MFESCRCGMSRMNIIMKQDLTVVEFTLKRANVGLPSLVSFGILKLRFFYQPLLEKRSSITYLS